MILLIALLIKLDSPEPALYTPQMIGKGSKPFHLFRFRTMYVDKPAHLNAAEWLTRIGRFIRNYSLDHLPTLFNVLKGDLSVIGPRPTEPEFVDMQDPTWQRYFQVRPGIAAAHCFGQSLPYYQVGELRIDTRKRRATLGERWVTLPPIQYRLLLALTQHAGEVVDCQELLRLVWGYDAAEAEARELVKVHIRQIRRRLGFDPETHNYIHSVRGFGYMLAPPDEE